MLPTESPLHAPVLGLGCGSWILSARGASFNHLLSWCTGLVPGWLVIGLDRLLRDLAGGLVGHPLSVGSLVLAVPYGGLRRLAGFLHTHLLLECTGLVPGRVGGAARSASLERCS